MIPAFQVSAEDVTMDNFSVSIVIPNYNGETYLRDCLASIGRHSEYEIILIDNASTDQSVTIVESEFPYVKILRNTENKGFSKAVNQGIESSVAPFVILLNNDTKVDKDFVSVLLHEIQKDNKIFSASSKMVQMQNPDIIDDTGDYYCALGWAYTCGKDKAESAYNRKRKVFASCAGAAIYRKSVFEEIGYFDEEHFAYLEDIDIGFRSIIFGYRNVYIPDAICRHAGSGSSGSRYNAFKIQLSSRNSIYMIYKNMPFLMILINLPLLFFGFLIKALFFAQKGYGKLYLRGLRRGFKLSFSDKGRAQKIPFSVGRTLTYCKIQLLLWLNVFRLLIK